MHITLVQLDWRHLHQIKFLYLHRPEKNMPTQRHFTAFWREGKEKKYNLHSRRQKREYSASTASLVEVVTETKNVLLRASQIVPKEKRK